MQEPLLAPGQQRMPKYWSGDTSDPFKVLESIEAVAITGDKLPGLEGLIGPCQGYQYLVSDKTTGSYLFVALETEGDFLDSKKKGVKIGMLKGDPAQIPPKRFAFLQRPSAEECAPCGCTWWRSSSPTMMLDAAAAPMFSIAEAALVNNELEVPFNDSSGKVVASIKKGNAKNRNEDNLTVFFTSALTGRQKFNAIEAALYMDQYILEGQPDATTRKLAGTANQVAGFFTGLFAGSTNQDQDRNEDNKVDDW